MQDSHAQTVTAELGMEVALFVLTRLFPQAIVEAAAHYLSNSTKP